MEEQRRVFEHAPAGLRKFIFATNVVTLYPSLIIANTLNAQYKLSTQGSLLFKI